MPGVELRESERVGRRGKRGKEASLLNLTSLIDCSDTRRLSPSEIFTGEAVVPTLPSGAPRCPFKFFFFLPREFSYVGLLFQVGRPRRFPFALCSTPLALEMIAPSEEPNQPISSDKEAYFRFSSSLSPLSSLSSLHSIQPLSRCRLALIPCPQPRSRLAIRRRKKDSEEPFLQQMVCQSSMKTMQTKELASPVRLRPSSLRRRRTQSDESLIVEYFTFSFLSMRNFKIDLSSSRQVVPILAAVYFVRFSSSLCIFSF